MKKQLNTTTIHNELSTGSAFFSKSVQQPPPPQSDSPPRPDKRNKAISKQGYRTKELSSDRVVKQQDNRETERISVRKSVRHAHQYPLSTKRPPPRRPAKRLTRRYSFEFYDDQIITLKKIKYKAEMRGERLNLSELAREAFDSFLEQF